jgi:hypothetical protein
MPITVNVIVPIVHSNGTGRRELLDQRCLAIDSLVAAGDALAKASPHDRDYYPRGGDYCQAAHRQHERRVGILQALIDELTAEAEALDT